MYVRRGVKKGKKKDNTCTLCYCVAAGDGYCFNTYFWPCIKVISSKEHIFSAY